MAVTGEAYGGAMLLPGWTNQQFTSNLEEGFAPTSLSSSGAAAQGYLAWSMNPLDVVSTFSPVSATTYLVRCMAPLAGVVSKMDLNATTAGTQTHVYAGLYSAAGALIASAVDFTASWGAGKNTFSWTTPALIAGGTFVWVALNLTWSVQPVLAAAAASSVQNFNTTAATALFSVAATSTVPLPATNAMASNTASALAIPWVALY